MTACASGIRRRLGATRASIATLLIGVVLGVGTGTALPAATPPAGTANNEVKETANTKAAPTESDSSDASSEDAHGLAMAAIDSAKAGFAARMNEVAKAPAEIARLKAAAGSTLLTGEGVRSLTYLLILILVGCAAEWLYWTYAASPLRLLLAAQPESRRHALGLGEGPPTERQP